MGAFLVGIAMGLGLYMVRTRRDFAYALVIIWHLSASSSRNAVTLSPDPGAADGGVGHRHW